MGRKIMAPIHPGEILMKDISVPGRRINEIVHGKRAIGEKSATAKMAVPIIFY
jgi:plasmid maintenance system antidote protein VapI